ncbi:DUF6705 family protein [Bacteroides sp.]
MSVIFLSVLASLSGQSILRDTLGCVKDTLLDEVIITKKYPTRHIERWFRTFNSLYESPPQKGELAVYRDEIDENLSKYEGVWQWKSADGDTIFTVKLVDGLIRIPIRVLDVNERLITDRQAQYHVNRLFGKFEYQVGDTILFSNLNEKQIFNYSYVKGERNKKNSKKKNFLIGVDVQPCSDTYVFLRMRRHKPFIKEHGIITFSLLDEKEGIALWRMELIVDSNEKNFMVRKAFKADTVFPTSVIMRRIGKK